MMTRIVVALAALALAIGNPANAQTSAPAASTDAKPAAKPAAVAPRHYASADEAVAALVEALRAGHARGLVAVLGSAGRPLVKSGDPVVDVQNRERFLHAYEASHKLVAKGEAMELRIGADDWPFPVPLVKDAKGWWFDVRRGREEVLARSIGRNELYTIQTCLAYVDAQREYYAEDRDGDGLLEYATQFASTSGKRDGLYWETKPGEPPSPLGALVTRARAEGYRRKSEGPTPYHGYVYRILTAQGPAAREGAYAYVTSGQMIGGFALVAFPARYGVSGVTTFVVNHEGVVHQKDLGPRTRALALEMKTYNPDETWTKAEVTEVAASSR
jgi:hypothetical protein